MCRDPRRVHDAEAALVQRRVLLPAVEMVEKLLKHGVDSIERRLQAAKGGLDLPKDGVVLTHAAALAA